MDTRSSSTVKNKTMVANNRKSSLSVKKVLIIISLVILAIVILYTLTRLTLLGWIDGRPVSRLEYYRNLERNYGEIVRQTIVLDLKLKQEAKTRQIELPVKEAEDKIKQYEVNYGGKDKFDEYLVSLGETRESYADRVLKSMIIDAIFGKNLTVGDKEIMEYIDQNKDRLGSQEFINFFNSESSESARYKEGIVEQVKKRKIEEAYQEWLKQEKIPESVHH